jgi:cell division protein FtsB
MTRRRTSGEGRRATRPRPAPTTTTTPVRSAGPVRRLLGGVVHLIARTVRALAFPVVVLATLAGVVAIGVFPARAYLDQKEAIAETQSQLTRVRADNQATQDEVQRLDSDDEIEKVAREQYGLVKPGEEVYHLLPAPQDPLTVPDQWPFDSLRRRLRAQPPPDPTAPTTTATSIAPVASPTPSVTVRH